MVVLIVKGIREPIFNSSVLFSPLGHKVSKKPRIKLFKNINKSILSQVTFYFEDDDYKAVDFNGETISFTCQLIQLYIFRFCKHTFIWVFILGGYVQL